MNRVVVGQASRLPPGRLAPGFVAGETPAKAAGTAAPLLPVPVHGRNARKLWRGGFPQFLFLLRGLTLLSAPARLPHKVVRWLRRTSV